MESNDLSPAHSRAKRLIHRFFHVAAVHLNPMVSPGNHLRAR
jgi:hypothetical protein